MRAKARKLAGSLSSGLADRQLERARKRLGPDSSQPGHPRPIAVVTGASGGVGRATAVRFSEAGFDVALIARGDGGLAAAAKNVEAAGGRALAVAADVAEFEQVSEAASKIDMFDSKAGGTLDPSFLTSLPQTSENFMKATKATLREKVEVWQRRFGKAA